MIMPMPNDDSQPVKLWLPERYKIDDAEAWMERYVRHNLRMLAEPITILANPTYLPPPVKDNYDQLWTDERMRQVIEKAVANHVALEINAKSEFPTTGSSAWRSRWARSSRSARTTSTTSRST